MYIIGSQALRHFNVSIGRDPKDWDYICLPEEFENFVEAHKHEVVCQKKSRRGFQLHVLKMLPLEFELIEEGSTAESLIQIVEEHNLYDTVNGTKYIEPSVIYTLKLSHRFLKNSRHFKKTMTDIKTLQLHGCRVPVCLSSWLDEREKETLNYEHPNLNQSKLTFFNDSVAYRYDHDSIHEAIKHYERPAYEYIKDDISEVLPSKVKFRNAPHEIKIRCGYEESLVLALERQLIPNNFIHDPRSSFLVALEKLCTGISSGEFREFCYENYDEIVALYDESYVTKFKQGLNDGIVKPYNIGS